MNHFIEVRNSLYQNPFVIFCLILLISLYLLNFALVDCPEKIALVIANTLITNNYVWNLITSCFYETSILKLILDIAILIWVTLKLDMNNIEQNGLYIIFTILSCTIGTSTYCFFRFFTSGIERILVNPIYGFSGILMCLLMLARHQFRNLPVHSSLPNITYHYLPIIYISTQTLLWCFGIKLLTRDLPFSVVSILFSWSYLRFYYKYTKSEPLGDKSEDFSFIFMFPEALHIVIIPFTTAFYNLIALCGIYPVLEVVEKKSYHHLRYADPGIADGSSLNAATSTVPVLQPKPDIVAERRKAKAMKLLDAKMAEMAGMKENEEWEEIDTSDQKDIEQQRVNLSVSPNSSTSSNPGSMISQSTTASGYLPINLPAITKSEINDMKKN